MLHVTNTIYAQERGSTIVLCTCCHRDAAMKAGRSGPQEVLNEARKHIDQRVDALEKKVDADVS